MMKKHISTGILFAFLLLFSIPNVMGTQAPDVTIGADNIYVENENIAVKITGGQNVPMYSFWDPAQTESKNLVKFILLFEIIDENQDGTYNPEEDTEVPLSTQALPAMSWSFSEIDTLEDNTTHFNITSQGAAFTIQFRNHIGADASLKFDVVIENYAFVSDSEDVMLVLGFQLLTGETEDEAETNSGEAEQTGERINFGDNAYFEAEPTADASGEAIGVGFSQGTEEGLPLAYIAYERFDGTLVHDPTIGIASGSDSDAIPGPTVSLLVAVAVITSILGMHRYKRRIR